MNEFGTFPFGQPIRKVTQKDRSKKRVFVLGVYASAVHARWIGPDGKQLINAVAVASEPEIFWRGEGAHEIVASIEIPEGVGRLVPAPQNLNGPSGRALDDLFLGPLGPLGLTREDAWLCDLVPYSCMNDRQAAALLRGYVSRADGLDLPDVRWGTVPVDLADEKRRTEIETEMSVAQPDILITLGDDPLKWFTKFFMSEAKLSDYGTGQGEYGRVHQIHFNGQKMGLLPLVHPRQAGKLGSHSARWNLLHDHWCKEVASGLL